MNKPSFHITAIFLILVYALTIASPLARALNTPHAMAAECAGNCDICGCSAERRANHTCCCWMKKLRHKGDGEKVADCCKKKMRHRMTMLSSNCPCGDNRMPGLAGFEKIEQLPFSYKTDILAIDEDTIHFSHVKSLTGIPGTPPDPPPKLSLSA